MTKDEFIEYLDEKVKDMIDDVEDVDYEFKDEIKSMLSDIITRLEEHEPDDRDIGDDDGDYDPDRA